MRQSSFDKWLVTLAMLVVIAGAVLHFIKSNRHAHEQRQPRTGARPVASGSKDEVFHPYYIPSAPGTTKAWPESDAAGFETIPREKVEAWLTRHHRSAMSLLAAFRALNDTNYLNEAATNLPNSPQIGLAVLAHDEFPADRRKWLELFKASSPGNSLANYLSAQDYFKNGNTDAAVQELLAATGKSQFDNFETESRLDAEALYLYAGKSRIESGRASLADVNVDVLPEMTTFKQLATEMGDLQKQQLAAGDASSAANLARMGLALGNQLTSGDSGKYIINQLVGIADENIVLAQLDPNTSCDFLGGQTPAQVLQQLKDQKKSYRELGRQFSAAYPSLTEEEMASYVQRSQIYGETQAMRWVVQQHPPGNP
jgi:hypothetical protein